MSAKKEILQLLTNFNPMIIENDMAKIKTKRDLSNLLIPCWNSDLFQSSLGLIDKALLTITSQSQTHNDTTFKYIMSTTYGEIDPPGNSIEIKSLHLL